MKVIGASMRRLAALVVGVGLAAVSGTARASQGQPASPKVTVTDYDMPQAALPSSLSEAELAGKKLFVQRCALCHDLLGQPSATTVGPWLDGETVKARGESAIREKIRMGSRRMPGWRYTFDASGIDRLVAYLKTVTPNQRPKPPRQAEVPVD